MPAYVHSQCSSDLSPHGLCTLATGAPSVKVWLAPRAHGLVKSTRANHNHGKISNGGSVPPITAKILCLNGYSVVSNPVYWKHWLKIYHQMSPVSGLGRQWCPVRSPWSMRGKLHGVSVIHCCYGTITRSMIYRWLPNCTSDRSRGEIRAYLRSSMAI